MKSENPQSGYPDDEINLLDLLQVLADNFRLLILAPLAIGMTALAISFAVPPTFTAETVFMPPQQQQGGAALMLQSLGALGGLAGAATGIKNPNDQFISLLKSNVVANELIGRFSLIEEYKSELLTDARDVLEGDSDISSSKDGLITISVSNKSPELAADIANAYVEELQKLLGRLAVTEAQQRRVFFENQLGSTKENLIVAEQQLRSTGVNVSALKSSPAAAVGLVAQLQAQIAAQEIKIASMRGYLTDAAPDFKQAMGELSALRNQLAKLESSSINPSSDTDYIARYRDFKYYETLFELFSKQYELAKVDEAREGAVIQVIDKATPPERKSKPKKGMIAVISTLASGFILLLFVFVRHAIRGAIEDEATGKKWLELRKAFRKSLGLR